MPTVRIPEPGPVLSRDRAAPGRVLPTVAIRGVDGHALGDEAQPQPKPASNIHGLE